MVIYFLLLILGINCHAHTFITHLYRLSLLDVSHADDLILPLREELSKGHNFDLKITFDGQLDDNQREKIMDAYYIFITAHQDRARITSLTVRPALSFAQVR